MVKRIKLSQKSIDTYDSIMAMLDTLIGTTKPEMYLNASNIIKKIQDSDYSLNSKKMLIVVAEKIAKGNNKSKQLDDAISLYSSTITSMNNTINLEISKNTLSEKEKKKFITLDEIIAVRNKLLKRYHKSNLKSDYIDYMLVSLYTMFPPRRVIDFCLMKIANKLDETTDKEHNFLLVSDKKMEFIFNRYKTDFAYGTQKFDVPKDLEKVLRYWIEKYQQGEYLLQYKPSYEPNENNLTKYMIRLFDAEAGKPAGISVLRHAYISHFNNKKMTVEQRKDISSKMAHSIFLQLEYAKE